MVRMLLLFLVTLGASASPVLVKDLRPSWTVYENGVYRPVGAVEQGVISTIYFSIDSRKFGGQSLLIKAAEDWHLFINGQLVSVGRGSFLSTIDSLRQEFGSSLFIGLRTTGGFGDVLTQIVYTGLPQNPLGRELTLRKPAFFRDFGIIVSVFLLVFFLLLLRSNPQLTLDYFSFSKIFSASERNETQLASRITSSANLLFYLFCALLTGFLLSAIFYSSAPSFSTARLMHIDSLVSAFRVWGILSASIFLLLTAKLTIVLVFSTLFNLRETTSFQFFNFLRVVLFTAVIMALMSLILFTFRVDSPVLYERLIALGLVMLTIGSIAVLLKLLRKSRFSFFHLFSYLCISEFIPLVIIFKIFF
jgi:Domain of unknown function (DUF4271)